LTFVDRFLKHTSSYESPDSFWRWSAYTAIAAVMRDNCYRQFGDNRIYPNIYTLVVADSAVHRKGAPVKLCEELVKRVKNTKIISGRSSIQGILDELARGETDKQTGKLLSGGSALFTASELSAGIVSDPEAIKILTDIYDFKDEYTSRLRGSGIFRVKNICFSLMAASNEELLRDVYDSKALFGGLLGRTFLVKPNEFRKANTLFGINDTTKEVELLVETLKSIAALSGEFVFTEAAEALYTSWYEPFRKGYEKKPDKSGIMGRIHTGVLKVAMIICADQTLSLRVEDAHIAEAIQHCTNLLSNYGSFIMSSGKSTISEVAAILIEEIWESDTRTVTKANFLTRHFHQFDHEIVDKCIETLEQAELLKQSLEGRSEIAYSVTQKCITTFDLKEKTK
jgi:hypothetical protein